jgi:BMFP domain-containing protein YqiC
MAGPSPIDELASRLQALAAQTPIADIERNAKALITGALSRLDLVTREEFDAQARVLARTREKLAALESRLAALEGRQPPGG